MNVSFCCLPATFPYNLPVPCPLFLLEMEQADRQVPNVWVGCSACLPATAKLTGNILKMPPYHPLPHTPHTHYLPHTTPPTFPIFNYFGFCYIIVPIFFFTAFSHLGIFEFATLCTLAGVYVPFLLVVILKHGKSHHGSIMSQEQWTDSGPGALPATGREEAMPCLQWEVVVGVPACE